VQLAELIHEEDPEALLLVVSSFASKRDVKDFFEKKNIELFEKPRFDKLLTRADSLLHELNIRS
jgi:hypothetical protein